MKNMKTLKIIVFASIALFGMAACSDEKKALNYVSEEIVSDNELNDFLIKYNILMFKDSFDPELRYYLSSISEKKHSTFSKVYLLDEYAHFDKYNWRMDVWYYYEPSKSYDSDRILNTILHLISQKLDNVLAERRVNFNDFTSIGISKERLFNYILSKAVFALSGAGLDECNLTMRQLGLNPDNFDHRRYYSYEWFVMGVHNQQSAFIDEVVNWIVSKCRDEVMSKNYKLVDKQCTTVGENQYNVTYLLEPQLEINFSVKKVGKTFVCENYSIDGNIINL